MKLFSFLLCFASFAGQAAAAAVITPYPDTELVESRTDDRAGTHEVMLGPLKKINNVLSSEAQEQVRGTRKIEIHLVRDEARVSAVAEYYQQQLDSAGVNRFRCIGRECGASNHWANAVFNERILYGSSEEQRYFASEIGAEFVVIYVTRRATGKIYVYTEILTPNNSNTVRAELILKSLRVQGRYVLPRKVDQELLLEIAALLKNNQAINLVVVGHAEKSRKLGLEATVEFSQRNAEELRMQLQELGVAEKRLKSKGLGYLAPDDRYSASRLELIAN